MLMPKPQSADNLDDLRRCNQFMSIACSGTFEQSATKGVKGIQGHLNVLGGPHLGENDHDRHPFFDQKI